MRINCILQTQKQMSVLLEKRRTNFCHRTARAPIGGSLSDPYAAYSGGHFRTQSSTNARA